MIIDLHTVTFDELLKSEHPVCCFRGKMWGGPARRGYNAIHPTELWKAWQMEISLALRNQHPQHRWTDVPQPVIDYYQRTKAFTKPPTEEQIRAYKEPVMTKNHLAPPKIKQQKNFSWSYTALNDFETCPFAYAEKRVYKTVPYVQSEEAKWGELVHLTAENYLNNRKQSQQAFVDQETLPLVKPFCDALVKAATGGTLLTEFEMAIDRKMQICGSREWNRAWGRGIADVVIIKGDTAWVYDWKSGKPKEDMTQLKLFCAFLALHYPQIQHFLSKFIWLKTKTTTGMDKPITKAEILEVWKDILVRVRRMEEAWVNEIFPMRKNGLCKNWCGVTSCPHCGK